VLILLVALAFVGTAALLALRGLASAEAGKHQNLGRIEAYGFAPATTALTAEAHPRVRDRVDRIADRLGVLVDRHVNTEHDLELRRQLYAAGLYSMTPGKFRGYRALATAGLVAFWLLTGARGNPVIAILGFIACGALGWVGPAFVVKRRATTRLDRMDYEMPELVDLLVTTVEGGLGFAAALQVATRNFDGPLGEEFRLALREQHMGLTMTEALSNVLTRTDTAAVRSFVQAVIQGESLGVSIGKVLRDLADDMRRRRRHAAQERAHKAATKIIFPVALLIFPAFFVVTLGPVAASILEALRG